MCEENDLDGRLLSVSKVPMSSAILVDNLNPQSSEEAVQLFFENTRRSGGGLVQRVELVPDEKKCIVFFEDYKGNLLVQTSLILWGKLKPPNLS